MINSLKKLKNDNINKSPQKNDKNVLNKDVEFYNDYNEITMTIVLWVVNTDN